MRVLYILRILLKLDLLKTIYFNFHYFPFKVAVYFPFFIYRHTKLYNMDGKIIIDAPIKFGMFRLGIRKLTIIDPVYSRTIWSHSGTLIVKGRAEIGQGSKINVDRNGTLILGDGFCVTGNTTIICDSEIKFGSNCLLSWDILIMDTDYHNVFNYNNDRLNPPKSISIGDNVWIGCRSIILKGVVIANNNVVAANSMITRSFAESNSIVAGHGRNADIIKSSINWML